MKLFGCLDTGLRAGAVALVALTLSGAAMAQSSTSPTSEPVERDGQHDFDFNIGVWQTHIKRILDPLSGATQSMELNGTVSVRKVWNGRAQIEEIEADGPNGHWQGLTLFLYNPKAHQWSQTFISSAAGTLSSSLVGSFADGRGELFETDTFNGRSILVRGVWSDIKPNSHHFQEDYSADGGKTWSPAFIAELVRAAAAPATSSATHDGNHEFDFDLGPWKTHSSRLLHPLTGSTEWVEMDGVTLVSQIWGGKANLAEFKANGPAGPLELLSLRWYNPVARQWNLDFATPGVGALGIPCVGEFAHGRGDFYDQEPVNGKTILVRFSIWPITADTAQSEQAFSADGGKTWEVNWINRYTRMGK